MRTRLSHESGSVIASAGRVALLLAAVVTARAAEPGGGTLDVVATAHLDTQWRWTIKTTVDEYIRNTLVDNLRLMDEYPGYVFSFEGAFRYQLMKEYYPALYEQVKRRVAEGRWRVAGSWLDAVDVNLPSPESLYRHALYGNGFFQREFGRRSRDVFLPDCFGFGYALPTIAAHSGILGFSTQKLGWGCFVGTPFDIGLWEGVDGSTLVAALNPGSYSEGFTNDLSADSSWIATCDEQRAASGLARAYKYFGTGDTGGAPDDSSVAWLERSLHGVGPLTVRSTGSDQLARDLTDLEKAALPCYKGELLMTRHGVGCYTSQAVMKRWNRQNEVLGDAAERANVLAAWLGAATYPRAALETAWTRFLWHQFHDDLTGTSIPEAYEYSWNDELLSQNQFASLVTDAVGGVARGLDTRVKGIPVVVFNPLAVPHRDLVRATLDWTGRPPSAVRVFDARDEECAASVEDGRVVFLADPPPLGMAVYEVRRNDDVRSDVARGSDLLPIGTGVLENQRYRVELGAPGITSIYDKHRGRELLAAPLRFDLLEDSPRNWPAWEIDYDDICATACDSLRFPDPPATARVPEPGDRTQDEDAPLHPRHATVLAGQVGMVARAAGRSSMGSRCDLTVRLGPGDADRIDIDLDVSWREQGRLLKLVVPLAAGSDSVTYDLGCGVIRRGLDRQELYEVPAQRWADLSAADGSGGLAVLTAAPAGWDHPAPGLLRLSLLRTPEVNPRWRGYADQASQDLGRHHIRLALYPHDGDWRQGVAEQADRFNQPLLAFQAAPHPGPLGKSISFVRLADAQGGTPPVALRALKRAEESGGEIVVRLQETEGHAADGVRLDFAALIRAVREINAAEEAAESAGPLELKNGVLSLGFRPFQPRTLALLVGPPSYGVRRTDCRPLTLPWNLDGVSQSGEAQGGDLDGRGTSLAADLLRFKPKRPIGIVEGMPVEEKVPPLQWRGLWFDIGPSQPGEANLLSCQGQELSLPDGDWESVWLLAAATGGGRESAFRAGDVVLKAWVPDLFEHFGQWDSRLAGGALATSYDEIAPVWVTPAEVAWVGTHRHKADGSDEACATTTFYAIRLELPKGSRTIILPDDPQVLILAATAASGDNGGLRPATPVMESTREAGARILTTRRAFADSLVVAFDSPTPGATLSCEFTSATGVIQQGTGSSFTLRESGTLSLLAQAPGLTSRPFVAHFEKLALRPAAFALDAELVGLRPGLARATYAGAWSALPDWSTLQPISTGRGERVTVPADAPVEDVGLAFRGFLRVPVTGVYVLHLSSDDGSRLGLGGALLIDNDGLHGSTDVTAEVLLEAGLHPLEVDFFQHLGGVDLRLQWEGPCLAQEEIPLASFRHQP